MRQRAVACNGSPRSVSLALFLSVHLCFQIRAREFGLGCGVVAETMIDIQLSPFLEQAQLLKIFISFRHEPYNFHASYRLYYFPYHACSILFCCRTPARGCSLPWQLAIQRP